MELNEKAKEEELVNSKIQELQEELKKSIETKENLQKAIIDWADKISNLEEELKRKIKEYEELQKQIKEQASLTLSKLSISSFEKMSDADAVFGKKTEEDTEKTENKTEDTEEIEEETKENTEKTEKNTKSVSNTKNKEEHTFLGELKDVILRNLCGLGVQDREFLEAYQKGFEAGLKLFDAKKQKTIIDNLKTEKGQEIVNDCLNKLLLNKTELSSLDKVMLQAKTTPSNPNNSSFNEMLNPSKAFRQAKEKEGIFKRIGNKVKAFAMVAIASVGLCSSISDRYANNWQSYKEPNPITRQVEFRQVNEDNIDDFINTYGAGYTQEEKDNFKSEYLKNLQPSQYRTKLTSKMADEVKQQANKGLLVAFKEGSYKSSGNSFIITENKDVRIL